MISMIRKVPLIHDSHEHFTLKNVPARVLKRNIKVSSVSLKF